MSKRIWMTPDHGDGAWRVGRGEPARLCDAQITVRKADARSGTTWDGVWVNGHRAYDVIVLVDAQVIYRVPDQRTAGLGTCYQRHEDAGGGLPFAGPAT